MWPVAPGARTVVAEVVEDVQANDVVEVKLVAAPQADEEDEIHDGVALYEFDQSIWDAALLQQCYDTGGQGGLDIGLSPELGFANSPAAYGHVYSAGEPVHASNCQRNADLAGWSAHERKLR